MTFLNGKMGSMTEMAEWKLECLAELNQAAQARAVGNEGMARVCARRAAGRVIREYFQRRGEVPPAKSAFKLLQVFSADEAQPEKVRQAADSFTLVITHDHVLPVDVDLIEEVNSLAKALLGEEVRPTD